MFTFCLKVFCRTWLQLKGVWLTSFFSNITLYGHGFELWYIYKSQTSKKKITPPCDHNINSKVESNFMGLKMMWLLIYYNIFFQMSSILCSLPDCSLTSPLYHQLNKLSHCVIFDLVTYFRL